VGGYKGSPEMESQTSLGRKLKMFLKNKKCLVTGGAGFIGSHIVKRLLREGVDEVVVLDNFVSGREDLLNGIIDKVELIRGDVTDAELVEKVMEDVDVVFHEAAQADVPASLRKPALDFEVNGLGTLNILRAALKNDVKRVVYASSASVYGNNVFSPQDRRFIESQALSPLSPYAASKLSGEMLCTAYYHSFGLKTTSLRYFSIYGPGEIPKKNSYSLVVSIFVPQAIQGKGLVLFGGGNQVRDFTHVEDVAYVNLLAAVKTEAVGKVINVGTGKATTIKDLAIIVKKLVRDVPYQYGPRPKGDPLGGYADTSRLKEIIGYVPEIQLQEGITQYADWYKKYNARAL
jgi:UDP-glucose 4-epimerase